MLHVLLLLLTLSSGSLGVDITLSSESDLANFANDVNTGTAYTKTTIYLGSDITLSGNIDPIGKGSNYFRGIFDGQGHIISNLQMNTSSQYTGLFGYAHGPTIRNVVLDGSCSVTSAFSSDSTQAQVGGIIGCCKSFDRRCIIENNVNMASVMFSGSNSTYLHIGGIVGGLSSTSGNDAYTKNCVNYGSVIHSGTVNKLAYLGGIVGYCSGFSSYLRSYIQNCLNYGAIIHNGTLGSTVVGGIVGYCSSYTYIENCVSTGKISKKPTTSGFNYIGGLVGWIDSSGTSINYCYYANDINASSTNGRGTPESTTETPNSPTTVNSELVSKLNSNATSCNWTRWLLNANNATVTFIMSDGKDLSFSSQIVLIPNPAKEGNSFLFWCKDAECTEVFDPETETVSGTTGLYAGWANGTVTFDFGNGTTVNETFSYNTEIIYPDMKKEGYTLSWDNYHELMPARDITVTAHWTPNNYTVAFDANGGSVLETSKIVTFNSVYGELPEANRAGYMFFGWRFTNETNGTEVTSETIITTPYNHTLFAHWEEVTTHVEIVFSTKDLTQEEVKEILKQHTTAKFEIINCENESGGMRVIVKFIGKEEAEKFVRDVKESNKTTNLIKKIGFDQSNHDSISTTIYPLLFFNALFL